MLGTVHPLHQKLKRMDDGLYQCPHCGVVGRPSGFWQTACLHPDDREARGWVRDPAGASRTPHKDGDE